MCMLKGGGLKSLGGCLPVKCLACAALHDYPHTDITEPHTLMLCRAHMGQTAVRSLRPEGLRTDGLYMQQAAGPTAVLVWPPHLQCLQCLQQHTRPQLLTIQLTRQPGQFPVRV
jgi:hypothetical protein